MAYWVNASAQKALLQIAESSMEQQQIVHCIFLIHILQPVAVVAEKNPMKPQCACKLCKCNTKLNKDKQIDIHSTFSSLKYDGRKQCIYSHIEETEPKRRYSTNESGDNDPKRKKSRKYFLPSTDSVTGMTTNTGMPEDVCEYS